MSADYWLGLATIPGFLVAVALGVGFWALLLERSGDDKIGCGRCGWEHHTKGNPWWLSHLKFAMHQRTHRKDAS